MNSSQNPSMEKNYLECGLPAFLEESILRMSSVWEKMDAGEECLRWDAFYDELQSNINVAENAQMISSEQAWHLREKYLRMEKDEYGFY